jgi:hypothetical protein
MSPVLLAPRRLRRIACDASPATHRLRRIACDASPATHRLRRIACEEGGAGELLDEEADKRVLGVSAAAAANLF